MPRAPTIKVASQTMLMATATWIHGTTGDDDLSSGVTMKPPSAQIATKKAPTPARRNASGRPPERRPSQSRGWSSAVAAEVRPMNSRPTRMTRASRVNSQNAGDSMSSSGRGWAGTSYGANHLTCAHAVTDGKASTRNMSAAARVIGAVRSGWLMGSHACNPATAKRPTTRRAITLQPRPLQTPRLASGRMMCSLNPPWELAPLQGFESN